MNTTMATQTELGDYLKRIFAQRNWSQRAAAEFLNVPQSLLSEVINKGRRPRNDILERIANGLDVSIDYLLSLSGLQLDHVNTSLILTPEEEQLLASLSPKQRDVLFQMARAMQDGHDQS